MKRALRAITTAFRQGVAAFLLASDDFPLNATVSDRVPAGPLDLVFHVRRTTLADDEARLHTSFLKELAPLPGRGVLFGVKATF